MLERFTVETFLPLLGEVFLIRHGDAAAHEARLLDAAAPPWRGAPRPREERRQPFSLVFHTAAHVRLPQRTYRLDHPGLGSFDLFLVPIGPDAEGMRYEAVFG